MRRIVTVLLILISAFLFCACGDISELKIIEVDSEKYSQEEIDEAIEVVKDYFLKNYDDCKLLTIQCAGDGNIDERLGLILISDLYTTEQYHSPGSKSPGETYTGWEWVMTQNENGKWEIKNMGWYGV
ncbi:MAG: hypothetical protein IJI19_06340 [Ruminococcus sp.]|nr:hypothetical protein [Ruminococcus sp.]